MSIFTKENGFVDESGMGYNDELRARLNKRYRMFMEPYADRFAGKRILDLASHDGRWCFASIKNGAAHVTGIEYRQSLIDKSSFILPPDIRSKIDLRQGDIFEVMPKLAKEKLQVDIITCLGIFYHILDHHMLMKMMHAFNPQLIIIDSLMIDSAERFVRIGSERNTSIRNAIPGGAKQSNSVIGLMSVGGLRHLAHHFGYTMHQATMSEADRKDKTGVQDYLTTSPGRATRRYVFMLEPAKKGSS